ncbi:hypothetical protein GCM10010104_63700 [Streptomyces indiaensis]|uniref:Uncharacterized protein n=1 Tax=Streptomyces indiaensis TaxID=284033 RepID=A0ABP5RCN4_9ACTN
MKPAARNQLSSQGRRDVDRVGLRRVGALSRTRPAAAAGQQNPRAQARRTFAQSTGTRPAGPGVG